MDDYNIDLYFETKSIGEIILIIVIVFILFLVFLFLFGVFQFPKTKRFETAPLPNQVVTSTLGASSNPRGVYVNNGADFLNEETCLSASNTSWDQNSLRCNCKQGYFGPKCDIPIHSPSYYALGETIKGSVEATEISDLQVYGISYNETPQTNFPTATNTCDNLENCIGFSYDYDTRFARFFSEFKLLDNGHIIYELDRPPKYYMKVGKNPVFPDRAFLIKGDTPLRYWLLDRYENFDTGSQTTSLLNETVYKMEYLPDKIINDGSLVGIYSQNLFNYKDIPNILSSGGNQYVIVRGSEVPSMNFALPYYVAYTKTT
jgi:hypothetical protein